MLSLLPWWLSGKESACQCRRCKRCRFDPWVEKIPQSRKWQPPPVFLPRKFHRQRSLAGYSPQGCKESNTTERLSTHAIKLAFTRMQNALIFTCCVIYLQRTQRETSVSVIFLNRYISAQKCATNITVDYLPKRASQYRYYCFIFIGKS